jgi:hypothetical protein
MDGRHDIWQNGIKNNATHHNEAHLNANEHYNIYSNDIQHNKTGVMN